MKTQKTSPDLTQFSALLRRPTVEQLTGKKRSTIYREIKQGLFPKTISLGGGKSAWNSREIEALNNARIAGKSDDEIKVLVAELHEARSAEQ